ncbi:MAG: TIGR02186 family protein [Desulfobacteraceae bacterium]
MKLIKRFILVAIWVVIGLSGLPLAIHAEQSPAAHLEPNLILMGASYNGTHVSLSGEAPRDAEVLVRLSGETANDTFLEKGRVLGILWMNKEAITFHHIPKIYQIYSPASITGSDLAENPTWQKLGIGFNALKNEATLTPDQADMDLQFSEFLKLKKEEGLYGVHENAVAYQNTTDGRKSFHAELAVPCAIPQGTYTVTTFIVKDGKILQTDNQALKIKETGLPAVISSLAFHHGILYGILATVIAIAAGLLTGLFFKESGSH